MFRISAITRVGLVAVACAAVAAPSALAKPPVKSLYGYAMSYTPSKATSKAATVQSVHYGYAMSYTPSKATPKKAATVQSAPYGYAMSYKPTKATTKKAAKVLSVHYGYAMSYKPTKATRKPAKPVAQMAATPSADPTVSGNTNYEYYGSPSGS